MSKKRTGPGLDAAREAFRSGDPVRANALCGDLLKSGHKKNPEVLQMAALSAHDLGDVLAALRMQGKAVKLAPRDPVLRINLASLLIQSGLNDKAMVHLSVAESVGSERPDILNGLARGYHAVDAPFNGIRHHSSAVEGFIRNAEKLLVKDPGAVETRCWLGRILHMTGREEAAEYHLGTALEQTAGAPEIRRQLIEIFISNGRYEEAEAHCRVLLSEQAAKAFAYISLSTIRADILNESDRDLILRMLAGTGLTNGERAALNYAMGRALDHDGDYGGAFAHFLAANKAEAPSAWGDLDAILKSFDDIVDGFSPESLTAVSAAQPARPIFIVGMPRSGTTLVEQILCAHSKVQGAGELGDISVMVSEFEAGKGYPAGVINLNQAGRKKLRDRYEAALEFHCPGAERVVDKMPRNFMHLGLIHAIYPDAVILHCTRSPMATCFSNFVTNYAVPSAADGDLVSIGRSYRGYIKMMERWKRLLPQGRLAEVVYEELIAEPEAQIRHLTKVCGLDWEPACLEFYRVKRPVRTASAVQVRKPISGDKCRHWQHYQRYLSPLVKALGDLAE